MHHLKPLVGSVDELGKVVPPIVEICCNSVTALVWVLFGFSKMAPKAMHCTVTGLLTVA